MLPFSAPYADVPGLLRLYCNVGGEKWSRPGGTASCRSNTRVLPADGVPVSLGNPPFCSALGDCGRLNVPVVVVGIQCLWYF